MSCYELGEHKNCRLMVKPRGQPTLINLPPSNIRKAENMEMKKEPPMPLLNIAGLSVGDHIPNEHNREPRCFKIRKMRGSRLPMRKTIVAHHVDGDSLNGFLQIRKI